MRLTNHSMTHLFLFYLMTGRIIAACLLLVTAVATLRVGIILVKTVSIFGGRGNAQVAVFIVEAEEGASSSLMPDCNTDMKTASCMFAVTNAKSGKTAEVSPDMMLS